MIIREQSGQLAPSRQAGADRLPIAMAFKLDQALRKRQDKKLLNVYQDLTLVEKVFVSMDKQLVDVDQGYLDIYQHLADVYLD